MIEISLLAGFLATIISSAVAYYSAVATFRFGWDPDNHSIPITSAIMDLAGTLCLVVVILLLGVTAHG
jgi:mgtE-like transporter